MRTQRWIGAILLALFLPASVLLGGELRGRVISRSGHTPVVGANVSLKNTRIGTVTDAEGEFHFDSLPPGTYTVVVSMLGFDKEKKDHVTVSDRGPPPFLEINLEESPVTIGEIVVRGRADRELETSGRMTERESNNIRNVITAQTIERSTDRTAADVLQRISGMSLIRIQGEGRYVVMRGLEQRYNNTLLDGIKIPSPEAKDRFVPMDIFPSALFERIEVTKALTPETAGDAIGGSTNLMFRDAPLKFMLSVNAAEGGTSGILGHTFYTFDRSAVPELDPDRLHGVVDDKDPTTQLAPRHNPTSKEFTVGHLKYSGSNTPLDGLYSAVSGGRLFDDRLGIVAAGSYQNTYNRVETDIYGVGSDINTVDKEGHLTPYATTKNSLLYYTNRKRWGATGKLDYILGLEQQVALGYVYVRQERTQYRDGLQITIDGSRGANDLTYLYRSALQVENISSVSLSGSHFTASPLSIRWTANYTDAVQDRPDEAEYSVLQNYDPYGHLQQFQGLGAITHVWRKNDDNQYLAKLDMTLRLTADGAHTVQAGFMGQKLKRANFQNDYKLNPAIINGRTQPFTSIDSAITTVFGQGSTSGTTVYGYQNYKADERLYGGYLQYELIWGSFQMLVGTRWEQALDRYFTMAPISVGHNENVVTTVDFLPGVHLRYDVTSDQVARFSVTRSMSRPGYFDLVPASERSDNSQSQGNPDLRPAHSTNVDLKYEYYPNVQDMYSLGLYYKQITDPIEDVFGSVGVVFTTSKGNGNPATLYGIEAALDKHFGDFGISGNYSYVYSEIVNPKLVPVLDAFGDPVVPVPSVQQKRPLQAQSPHIANVSLTYRNPEWGTGINLSYNYTGRRLVAVGLIDGYDTYDNGVGELDLAADQRLFGNVTIALKLINLLNSTVTTEVASGDYIKHAPITILETYNKLRGTVGVNIRF